MSKNKAQMLKPVWIVRASLAIILLLLFHKSFESGQVLFSSDGPLGTNGAAFNGLPSAFSGIWQDAYFLGDWRGSAPISISWSLLFLMGAVGYAKFYIPATLLILGMSAWTFFRQLKMSTSTCLIAALATALNGGFFSYACWGLGSLPLTISMFFLALAALASTARANLWTKTILAGFAIGMGIMEGFDVGAILSLFIAAFVIFQTFTSVGRTKTKVKTGAARLALVAIFAAVLSAQTLSSLISTEVEGVAVLEQNSMTKEQRWDWATQWSLPKTETLRLLMPGIFGYRMDTPDGGQYWGSVGQTPGWETHQQGLARHSGSGFYGGVIVCLIAVFGVVYSFKSRGGPFDGAERKRIWFWLGVFVISLMLSWGRHFPLYQLFYMLPGASNIRNPIKFLHTLDISLIILFAHGLEAMVRTFVGSTPSTAGFAKHLGNWWKRLKDTDRKWVFGNFIALGAGVLFILIWISSKSEIISHLQSAGFDPASAQAVAAFSTGQFGWFIGLLVCSSVLVMLTMSRWFSKSRQTLWTVLFFALVLVDLGKSNLPWIVHYDYKAKYAEDDLIKFLEKDSPQQRVTTWQYQLFENPQLITILNNLESLYRAEWIQHQFPYYNIQSLEYAQEPREATENAAFRAALHPISPEAPNQLQWEKVFRNWELTSTKYILCPGGGFADFLNTNFDPTGNRFKSRLNFTLEDNGAGGYRTVENPAGSFAVVEFGGALPKAKLYSNWLKSEDDNATLQKLSTTDFVPSQQVLVSGIDSSNAKATNDVSGSVVWKDYSSKHITLEVETDQRAVLLLNDKHNPNWQVTVDGESRPLLRCNYIMRGVEVEAGKHTVEFKFSPPREAMIVTLLGILGTVGLCGRMVWASQFKKRK